MSTTDDSKLMLRYAIRDEFTDKLEETCNMKSRVCRGGSKSLYHLLIQSNSMGQYMNLDKDHLQIVSGMGHTFIRYKDDANNRFLYIDPTIAQFDPTFDGIFIGDEQDLRTIAEKQKNMKGYKLNLGDYLGSSYEGKTYELPPLTIEIAMMTGGTRSIKKIKKLKGCTRKEFKSRICGNYQGLLFMKNGKKEKLFFRSSEERESYYKIHIKGNKEYSKFIRYSVCSKTTPTRKQRRC